MRKPETEVPYGTLDLMVLTTLSSMGRLHGYGIARRIEQVAEGALAGAFVINCCWDGTKGVSRR